MMNNFLTLLLEFNYTQRVTWFNPKEIAAMKVPNLISNM